MCPIVFAGGQVLPEPARGHSLSKDWLSPRGAWGHILSQDWWSRRRGWRQGGSVDPPRRHHHRVCSVPEANLDGRGRCGEVSRV